MMKITVPAIAKMKAEGRKITMVTAYDFPTAAIADAAGIDIILVGDSVGNVVLGYPSTIPVTMDETIHHTRAAARGRKNALLVADLPFLSYQVSLEEAIRNSGRCLKEAEAEAVKLEGGERVARTIEAISNADIPVMAHIGLTPQSVHALGGYRVQGRGDESRRRLLADAQAVEAAGAFSVVLEAIPGELAREITETIHIPTIGIGAGPHCSGQVLVFHDLVGLSERKVPSFVKKYADLYGAGVKAVQQFVSEVQSGKFPDEAHTYKSEK
ncbi:MAG: 3-methyl-2-oxobutanoate hydroxymethyltransferase [Proteobacteria bacterium]|nr:3-methyl-2-oxobutanoate hydroxymethyltransferase [Pseudomonadota bacterium]